MGAQADAAPWVIVAGGFHQRGGMDRANAALASYLLARGTPVHLTGHEIDPALAAHPLATADVVPRPRGMARLAETLLARAGVRAARRALSRSSAARVVVNGGNCPWPDVNWVHAVHAAWPVHDDGAPWWSRYRNRRLKQLAWQRERTALRQARLVIANSQATKRAVVDLVGVDGPRVHVAYLGSDPAWGAADAAERTSARAALGLSDTRPVAIFVGALGTDVNKGFDVLWSAWKSLASSGDWDAQLVVAGGGWRLRRWRDDAQQHRAGSAVRFLGFTPAIREVLAAADLLVSPVRYEAYGLNVHEALCRGLAVMVTRTAGVTERFDAAMTDALLPESVTPARLAGCLRAWREDVEGWRARAAATAARLRSRSWDDMAAEFVGLVRQAPQGIPA